MTHEMKVAVVVDALLTVIAENECGSLCIWAGDTCQAIFWSSFFHFSSKIKDVRTTAEGTI